MRRGFLNKPSKSSTTRVVKNRSNDTPPATNGMDIGVSKPVSAQVTTSAKQTLKTPHEPTALPWSITNSNMLHIERFPEPHSLQAGEPITTALLFEGTSEALRSLPNFLKAPFEMLDWPCVVKDIQNMGKGLFARETIRPGALIIDERVVAIMPLQVPDRYLELLFSRLADNDRQEMFRLHNCHNASVPRVLGVVATNMMSIGRLPGPYTGEHAGLCRIISRINHSCGPNAYWDFDVDSLSVIVRASQTIEKGQQIFISYTPLFISREERQAHLARYFFTCTCPSCSLPPHESMRSDIRRKLLHTADQKFNNDASLGPHPLPDDSSIKTSKRVLDMMEVESAYDKNLAVFHCINLSTAYCMLGDRKGAVEWGRKAVEFGETFGTGAGEQKEYLEAPEKSPVWKTRLPKFFRD